MNPSPTMRWSVLALCTLTVIVVYTIPTLMLPVMFAEIAADLDLDILRLGIAWGSLSLSSMVVGLFGGAIGDRLGSKVMLSAACVLAGIFGALRGLVPSYALLLVTFMLYGLVAPSIPPNLHKAGAYLFPNQRGISTGAISMGFAFSLFIGARFTATWLSPAVGGWRNVMLLFGGLAILFALLWYVAVPDEALPPAANRDRPFFESISTSLQQVLKIREVWIIGIASALFWACFRGFAGYTPLYLRGLGWDPVEADNALSFYFLASMLLALPAVYWSERVGNRKPFLIAAVLSGGIGVLLLGAGNELIIVAALFGSGLLFDAFMAIHQAEALSLKGVGPYAGSVLGILVMFREIGGFISPPIGNALAQLGPAVPFIFWGSMGVLSAIVFLLLPRSTPELHTTPAD